MKGKQTYSAKVIGQKGNSPDYKLKSQNKNLVKKIISFFKSNDKLA